MKSFYNFRKLKIYESKKYDRDPQAAMRTFMSDRRDYDPYWLVSVGNGESYVVLRLANESEYQACKKMSLHEKLRFICNAHKLIS